ncbi:MAG: sialidase family protein [Vicinamibacterales bacterium]
MRFRIVVVLLAAGLVLVGFGAPPAAGVIRGGQGGLDVRSVPSPAAPASGEAQLTVSSRGVLMSWIEREGPRASLKFAERTATGWTPTRTVASGNDRFVNWADVPSVLRLSDGTLAAHWLQKSGPGTYAYDVRLSYSTDDGRTWAASFLPHHDGVRAEHGFASLFELEQGLGLVWLDGRETAGADAEGAMTLRFAAFDRGWTQIADEAIDRRVCDCCPTTAAVTADGVITAFRDRSQDEIRDIAVSRFDAGRWTAPAAVHDDGWRINACPVNGPAVAARGREVALAWFSGREAPGHAFVAFSHDAGRTFGAPVRVDEQGSQGRVDVDLLDDGSVLVSWIEYADRRADFRVRRVAASGDPGPVTVIAPLTATRASGYPRLARHGDELVLAWTDVGDRAAGAGPEALRVVTAVASLPPSR